MCVRALTPCHPALGRAPPFLLKAAHHIYIHTHVYTVDIAWSSLAYSTCKVASTGRALIQMGKLPRVVVNSVQEAGGGMKFRGWLKVKPRCNQKRPYVTLTLARTRVNWGERSITSFYPFSAYLYFSSHTVHLIHFTPSILTFCVTYRNSNFSARELWKFFVDQLIDLTLYYE